MPPSDAMLDWIVPPAKLELPKRCTSGEQQTLVSPWIARAAIKNTIQRITGNIDLPSSTLSKQVLPTWTAGWHYHVTCEDYPIKLMFSKDFEKLWGDNPMTHITGLWSNIKLARCQKRCYVAILYSISRHFHQRITCERRQIWQIKISVCCLCNNNVKE